MCVRACVRAGCERASVIERDRHTTGEALSLSKLAQTISASAYEVFVANFNNIPYTRSCIFAPIDCV